MEIAFLLFAFFGWLFDDSKESQKREYKKPKKRSNRDSGKTWFDKLNAGDQAWLYEHYK